MSWNSAVKKALPLLCAGLLGSVLGGFLLWNHVLGNLETTLLGALKHQYWARRADCDEAYFAGGEIAEFGLKKTISLARFFHKAAVIDASERDFDIFVSLARMAKVKRDSGDERTAERYVRQALSLARTLELDDTVSDTEQLFVYLARDVDWDKGGDSMAAGVVPEDSTGEKSAGEQ